MSENVTVRLFVSTQTYDIPCDPRQSAKWLLEQAKNIQRSNSQPRNSEQFHDELEVLYNRTRRRVIELNEPIGTNIAPMDVIDARTLLQTPDTTANSAMFPWLRSYPGGLQPSDENINSANGLFFQQLYAYTLIGRRSPQLASQRREQKKQDDFLRLLQAYVMGSFPNEQRYSEISYGEHGNNQHLKMHPSSPTNPSASLNVQPRRSSDRPGSVNFFGSKQETTTTIPPRRLTEQLSPERDSVIVSDEPLVARVNRLTVNDVASRQIGTHPSSPGVTLQHPPVVRRAASENLLDEMENVFDIVFKQQAIGMKLGSDETKQFAVVKECFEGSEARRYPEIQNGVVILAVNGQEVSGLGLARVLYRLREAPRPVVVRFGRISSKNGLLASEHHARTGTWG